MSGGEFPRQFVELLTLHLALSFEWENSGSVPSRDPLPPRANAAPGHGQNVRGIGVESRILNV
jgi:hypothetical protein